MTKPVVINNIQPKQRRGSPYSVGQFTNTRDNHNAVVIRNESIRIYGVYCGKPYDITFKMGDMAEYDSFNLRYLGTVEGITDKNVTIKPRYSDRTKRLDLHTFCWRNYNFDLERINAENAETSHYI